MLYLSVLSKVWEALREFIWVLGLYFAKIALLLLGSSSFIGAIAFYHHFSYVWF